MKRIFAIFLALSLIFALCACASSSAGKIPDKASDTFISGALEAEAEDEAPAQEQTPAASTDKKPAKEQPAKEQSDVKTPTLEDRFMATWTVNEVTPQEPQEFSMDAATSIDVLREDIDGMPSVFGMAYIGYYDGTEDMDFAQWYGQAASSLIAAYQFIYEIDAAHTVGTYGHLYCVIAQYDSSIEVKTIDDDEVLYTAENGEPILVFCNRDGDATVADISVTITTADGTACTWLPIIDEFGFPDILVGDERAALSYDFRAPLTFGYYFDAEDLLREGWLGASAYGLAGDDVLNPNSWTITMWDEEKQTFVDFSLTFCPNPSSSGAYDGEVIMECAYEGESGAQGEWEGWWRLETKDDRPSRLEIDLMLMRGDDMEHYEDVPYTSESYWVMMHPNGEVMMLVPESGYSALAFMGVGVPAVELVLEMG